MQCYVRSPGRYADFYKTGNYPKDFQAVLRKERGNVANRYADFYKTGNYPKDLQAVLRKQCENLANRYAELRKY